MKMNNPTALLSIAAVALQMILMAPMPFASGFAPTSINIIHQRSVTDSDTLTTLGMSSTAKKAETEEDNPRLSGLAFDLDDGTRKSHSIAQNSAFVTGFFKGLSTRGAYSKLLTSLYFVYTAMEDSFDGTEEQTVKTMDDTELRRTTALAMDMEYFYGPGWEKKISPSPAAQKYVNRVLEVARDQPRLLIAHQYTRYLGDLFGGQMMGGMAQRSLGLEDKKGTAFYTFDEIDSTKDFITAWYKKLNELDLSDDEKKDIVDEANYVFALNIEILEELDGSAWKAVWTLAWTSFREKMGLTKSK